MSSAGADRKLLAGLCACLVLSGIAALIYETVWARHLSYYFSGTGLTACLVLSAFMGGMALGSAAGGRLAGSPRAALQGYAMIELALAALGAAFPWLLDDVGALYVGLARSLGPQSGGLFALKFSLFAVTLSIPALLMGATLPLMVAVTAAHTREQGRRLGALYSANCAGGVAGGLASGFLLIEALGLSRTSFCAAAANAAAATLALALGGLVDQPAGEPAVPSGAPDTAAPAAAPGATAAEAARVPPAGPAAAGAAAFAAGPLIVEPLARIEQPAEPTASARETGSGAAAGTGEAFAIARSHRRALLFVSGFTAMAYEVLWARVLPLILGSSTYSFSLMLATFVAGVAMGSLGFASWRRRVREPDRVFALAQFGIGAWVILSMPLYRWLPVVFLAARTALGVSFQTYWLAALVLNAAVMIVPALLFGAGLPAALEGARTASENFHRSVGDLYAVNTFGNVTGSLAAGLLLIPGLGSPTTFQVCALLNIASALSCVAILPWARMPALRWATTIALAAFVLAPFSRSWFPRLTIGAFSRIKPRTMDEVRRAIALPGQKSVELLDEDISGTTAVARTGSELLLFVNGKVDASNGQDMGSQVLIAQLPLLMHTDPRTMFILGLGSGVTAGSALTHPLERLDCAEIARGVKEAAVLFAPVNGHPWTDPRFHLYEDDGRHFLSLHPSRYDVIVTEPSNPWMVGMSKLFTREFLGMVRDHLAKGGLLVQWVQLYETDQEDLGLILRTFGSVFPYVRSFLQTESTDLILVGAMEPDTLLSANLAGRIQERMQRPRVREDLQRVGIRSPFTLASGEWMGDGTLGAFAGAGPVLTDDRPRLEFSAPRAYYSDVKVAIPAPDHPIADSILQRLLAGRPPSVADLEDFVDRRLHSQDLRGVAQFLSGPQMPQDPRVWYLTAIVLLAQGNSEAALPWAQKAFRAMPTNLDCAKVLHQIAVRVERTDLPLLGPRPFSISRESARAIASLDPKDAQIELELADLALDAQDLAEADRMLRQAVERARSGTARPDQILPSLLLKAAQIHLAGRDYDHTQEFAQDAKIFDPGSEGARSVLQALSATRGIEIR